MQHGLSPLQYVVKNSCKFCKFLDCSVVELAFSTTDYLWFEFLKALGLDFLSFPTTITNTLHELVHFNQSQSARFRIFPRELQSVYHPSKAHHASTIKPNFVYDSMHCFSPSLFFRLLNGQDLSQRLIPVLGLVINKIIVFGHFSTGMKFSFHTITDVSLVQHKSANLISD